MTFTLEAARQILGRTPQVLDTLLNGVSDEWTLVNEGGDTWNALEIVGHLYYCDTHNWLLRAKHILKDEDNTVLPAFDRLGHLAALQHQSLPQLLEAFKQRREEVLQEIKELKLKEVTFSTKGKHPQFGTVTLAQLFSTWVVHDLAHTAQVCRVMAKQYKEEVGPWIEYLRILK